MVSGSFGVLMFANFVGFGQIGPYIFILSYDLDLENVFENKKFLSRTVSEYTESEIDCSEHEKIIYYFFYFS